jgi:N-acetylglutamate synthase
MRVVPEPGDHGDVEIPDRLLGRRVSLRHRVGERAGRPLFSDAVGELAADGAGAVLVRTRRGPVRVLRSAVVAVRAVPPAPPRRASWAAVARLEGLCADAWPAVVDRPLGAWRLRAAGGFTGRANSALAIGDPGRPIPSALSAVREFAAEHGIAPRVHAPIGSPWDRAVTAQGWELDVEHVAGPVSAMLVAPVHGERDPRVGLTERPTPEWWRLGPADPPTAAQRAVVDPGDPLPIAFALVHGPGGEPAGHLRAAVVSDHLHLALLAVAPDVRRGGLGRALVASAMWWGLGRGARWAVLQVAVHNSDALDFYRRIGFVEHHRYRYLVPS